jgi:stage III sporulation protein AF
MLEWFRSWATGIVIAVIIATIIEMILPNSTSKKYIKIIIGIFIVYTIISPVIGSFKGEDLNNYIKVENYIQSNSNALKTNEVSDNAQSSIKKIYSQNLQNDLKTKLKEKGYISNNINISISNDDKYNIERIDIKVDEKVTNSNQDEKQVKTIVDNIFFITLCYVRNFAFFYFYVMLPEFDIFTISVVPIIIIVDILNISPSRILNVSPIVSNSFTTFSSAIGSHIAAPI